MFPATLEVTRIDDRDDGAESSDKMLTLLTTTIDWMMMIKKKC
jgi:hypothetical protein